MIVTGIVTKGYGWASQAIHLQKENLKKYNIPDLENYYEGTINVNIKPKKMKIINPDYKIPPFDWGAGFKEGFSIVRCTIKYKNIEQEGLIYCPMPTDRKVYPEDDIIELLTFKIENLIHGEKISIEFDERRVIFV